MRVWLLQISEPLPMDGPQVRLLRTAVLAERLLARGHEVLWWSGAFDHIHKRHRVRRSRKAPLWDRGEVYLLAGCGYQKNVSLRRVLDHFQVAREFAKLAPRESEPDILVASLPSQDFCAAAADYAVKRGIPFIVDVRDQWPDVWLEAIPRCLRPIFRWVLQPIFWQTAWTCQMATGLVGATSPLLHWGLRYANRARGVWDRVFFLGYRRPQYGSAVLEEARNFWDRRGIVGSAQELNICFCGTLSRQFAWEAIVKAAKYTESKQLPVRWILCGKGDASKNLQTELRGLSSVYWADWVDGPKLQTLMERSHLGLAPYRKTPNFWGAIPNKIAQYFSEGLPVLSTLVGGLEELLEQNRCGWTYDPDNAEQLIRLIEAILQQKHDLPEMGLRAKKVFADYLDAEKIYPAYVEYIEEAAQMGQVKRQAA